MGRPVTWASSDTTRVRILADGTVSAVAAGTATITAVREGQRTVATVFVSSPQLPTVPTVVVQPVFFFRVVAGHGGPAPADGREPGGPPDP